MSKRLRTILTNLLVLTLLVASMPFAALSETVPVAEPIAETTEVPVEEPVAEVTEAPVEEPVAEATEVPVEEPAAEATEAPLEEPTAEATEVPIEEPATEATEVPTEESSNELSDAQKAALENLPAGFSAGTVALAMMRSTGCAHTDFYVWENSDPRQYTALNDEKHTYTYRVKSRTLNCNDCGETLQEITVNETISGEERHGWVNVDTTSVIRCIECGMTQKLENPCSHSDKYSMGEDGNLYCWVCGALVVLNPEQTYCEHTHYTEYGGSDKPLISYDAFSKEQHVKQLQTLIFTGGWGFAICDDCGEWLELMNGEINADGITDIGADDYEWASVLELHTFENGACKFCGEKEVTCKHEETEEKENLDKQTSNVERVDKDKHKIITTHYYDLYCKSCNGYAGEGRTDVTSREEAHTFNSKNVCTVCGYGETCEHRDAKLFHYNKGDTFIRYEWTGNGDTHYVISYNVLAEFYYCYGCGKVYIPAAGDSGEICDQDFVSADFAMSEVYRYVDDCYMTNGWTQDYKDCNYCGHREGETSSTPCDHSAGNYRDVLDESVAAVYSNINEETHCVQRSYKRYCKDCGGYIRNVVDEALQPIPHDFSKGNTCPCGYECPHTNAEITTKVSKRLIGTRDATYHIVQISDVETCKCPDCGLDRTTYSNVKYQKEEHSFVVSTNSVSNIAAVCKECGYARSLTEKEAWKEIDTFIQNSTIDVITTWVMNQSNILTVAESTMKLPEVVGSPYKAIKEAVSRGTDAYYGDMMRTILIDVLVGEKEKLLDSLDGELGTSLDLLLKRGKTFGSTDEVKNFIDGLKEKLLNENQIEKVDKIGELYKNAGEAYKAVKAGMGLVDDMKEWAGLMDDYYLNIQILSRIGATVSQDSELYKACVSLQNELLSEWGACAEASSLVLDKLSSQALNEVGKDLMKALEKADLPLLSLLSKSDKFLKIFPNFYKELQEGIDAKEDIMNLYVLRVDVATELQNAIANGSNASGDIAIIYSQIVNKEFDAVENYLEAQRKQQEGVLGSIGRLFGRGDNYTAAEWLEDLDKDRDAFTDVYWKALKNAK